MRLRCTNCTAAFEGELDARCPKCLRRTSVLESVDAPESHRDEVPAAWPAGPSCPLCMARPVSDATFYLELAAVGAGAGGSHQEWKGVRCRSCDACRERVVAMTRLRWTALPFVAVGTLAWIFTLVSDLPLRLFGIAKLEAVMLSTLLCAFIVGGPLVVLDRANSRVRRTVETSWLLRRVQARLGHPEGALPPEQWKIVADAPEGAEVIDAADLLRS